MRPEPRRPSPAGRLALCGAGGWLLVRGALGGGPLGLLQAVLGAAALYRAATRPAGDHPVLDPRQGIRTPFQSRPQPVRLPGLLKEAPMSISYDIDAGTCSIELNGNHCELPIRDVVVTTDEGLRASVIHCTAGTALLTEDQAQALIGAGARDERFNLLAD
ncbi:DUF3203 family protein [Metapseudomonas otitidis]|uniref:DUF3203 family protein n=1 Tax=Metapseudomonas otitidis TaxID=319939 RepID=UPI00244B3656|nr:DUF3203 family protein [Pseudomonas otitidis]MDH1166940.1 DUF3203 family protein [Pseudomonas otitidis]